MTEIIVSISLYLVAAILLGFTFGWFIAKSMLKEKYDEQLEVLSSLQNSNDIEKIKGELIECRSSNRELVASQNDLRMEYEEKSRFSVSKLEVDTDNESEVVEGLKSEFSKLEEKYLNLKQQHEKEIEAFLNERVDITQKYKELLEQVTKDKESASQRREESGSPEKKSSWFGKALE